MQNPRKDIQIVFKISIYLYKYTLIVIYYIYNVNYLFYILFLLFYRLLLAILMYYVIWFNFLVESRVYLPPLDLIPSHSYYLARAIVNPTI